MRKQGEMPVRLWPWAPCLGSLRGAKVSSKPKNFSLICEISSAVERNLAEVDVTGSNPVFRFGFPNRSVRLPGLYILPKRRYDSKAVERGGFAPLKTLKIAN